MNLSYLYTAIPQEPSGLLVQFVDFEAGFTEGETLEGAVFNAAVVLSGVIACPIDHGPTIPQPSPAEGRPVALPSATVQSALLLRQSRGERSITELVRGLDTQRFNKY